MANQRLTWEDLEDEPQTPTVPGEIVPPSAGVTLDWGAILDRINTMLGYAVEILQRAPTAIEGGMLKRLIASRQAAQPNGTPPNTGGEAPQAPTPQTAFVALYQLDQYVALSLPNITVAEALDLFERHGEDMLPKLKGIIHSAGLEDSKLSDLCLFALPLKQGQITGYLASLPELEAKREAGG